MSQTGSKRRQRGSIVRRGNSYRVLMYAGRDPLTGRRVYLDESTTDAREAQKILNRFRHRSISSGRRAPRERSGTP